MAGHGCGALSRPGLLPLRGPLTGLLRVDCHVGQIPNESSGPMHQQQQYDDGEPRRFSFLIKRCDRGNGGQLDAPGGLRGVRVRVVARSLAADEAWE